MYNWNSPQVQELHREELLLEVRQRARVQEARQAGRAARAGAPSTRPVEALVRRLAHVRLQLRGRAPVVAEVGCPQPGEC